MLSSHFPSKVLLLGEYTILSGSKALALPYHAFSGKWSFSELHSPRTCHSQESLLAIAEKSQNASVDFMKLIEDVKNGLWFDSSIPQGYGLGSSGAVIAAIYERYGSPVKNIHKDKYALARLEDYFHGSSSGLDPLVSHIQKPLLIHNFNEVEVLEERPKLDGFFLVNTGKPRKTGPLVSIYQAKMKDPQFKKSCAEILATEVNFAIDAVIKKDNSKLFHHLWHISKFQWDFFSEMIPEKEREFWIKGLDTGDYILKLCGAGGGGFLLGYSAKYNFTEMSEFLSLHELKDLS